MTEEDLSDIEFIPPEEDSFKKEYTVPQQQPFSEVVKIWLKFPKFTKEMFKSQINKVNIRHTLWGALILAVLTSVLNLFYPVAECTFIPEKASSFFCPHYMFPSTIIKEFVTNFSSFYLGNLLLLGLIKVAGGKGNYSTQAYINILFLVPVNLLSLLSTYFQLIPAVGDYITFCFYLVLCILNFIFYARLLQTVHKFSKKKAIGFILIPIILYLLIVIIPIIAKLAHLI